VEPARAPGHESAGINQERFLAFYDSAVRPLFGYLYRATGGNRDLAEDLCQDVFAVALRRARAGDVDVLRIPWVMTVGRNRLIDHWRRTAREERRFAQLKAIESNHDREHDEALLAQLRSLPAMQRAAVVLHYLDGLPVDDVARRLGRSFKATESLLSRARQALRANGGTDHE